MKDVSNAITKRMQRLDRHFSVEWLCDFKALISFLKSNSKTNQILKGIQGDKMQDQTPLIDNFEHLLEDGRHCLQRMIMEIKNLANSQIKQDIEELRSIRIPTEKLKDPFFELESFYSDYCRRWMGLVRMLLKLDEKCSFLDEYARITPKVDDAAKVEINLLFSKNLRACEIEVGNLAGKRSASIWGKWDFILKWEEWTKNGIDPDNEDYRISLAVFFDGLGIGSIVQSVGLYFIEQLVSEQMSPITTLSIHALELFLDAKDRYWIITHTHDGKGYDKNPYFIKRLQSGSKPYCLLKILLDTERGSSIDFEKMPHTLGELEIKNGLEKAIFPFGCFMGCYVDHKDFEPAMDLEIVLKRLEAIQQGKKKIPAFDNGYYFRSKRL